MVVIGRNCASRISRHSAWQSAGGAIFVGDNRAAQDPSAVSSPAPEAAGREAMRATKVADPGRSIFVDGPGLAAGEDR